MSGKFSLKNRNPTIAITEGETMKPGSFWVKLNFALTVLCLLLIVFSMSGGSDKSESGHVVAAYKATGKDTVFVSDTTLAEDMAYMFTSLQVELSRLAIKTDSLALLFEKQQRLVSAPRPRKRQASKGQAAQSNGALKLSQFFDSEQAVTKLVRVSASAADANWLKLRIPESQLVYDESVVAMLSLEEVRIGTGVVPSGSTFEGICSIRTNKVEIRLTRVLTKDGALNIEGDVYSSGDNGGSRVKGVRVTIKQKKNVLAGLTNRGKDIIRAFDPTSATDVLLQDDLEANELQAELPAMRVYALIRGVR